MKYLSFLFTTLLLQCSPLRAAAPTTGQFLFQQKPVSGPFNQFGVTPLTNQVFGWDGTNVVMFGPGGGISWGSITGTLSGQTDLQAALNAKLSLTGTLALSNFGSITGILPVGNLPGTVQLTTGTLALGNFASITGTLADARLSANVQLKNGTLALASFGSITGTLPTGNLPATIPDGNLSANVQLKNGALALAGFGSITGTVPAVNIADLSGTYLTTATAATTYQPLDADLTAIAALSGTHNIYYRSAANTWSSLTIGTGLDFTGSTLSNQNSGTVTSVALTAPNIFSLSGSPITSSGTLALSLATQTAHFVWSGPTSGSAATPTFRALVATDLPDISATYLTTATAATTYQPLNGNLTALAATTGSNSLFYRSGVNTWTPVSFGSGITFSGGTISSTSGGGTVTSVSLALPGIFSVSGSPVTGSGTLTATLANQTTKTFLAGPVSGAATTPAFRVIASGDIPDLSTTYLTPTAAAAAYQPLDGDLTALAGLSGTNTIYYRSAADTWTSVTVGTGLTFTGGTLAASSAGTVSSVALSLPGMFTVSGSPITTTGTLSASLANQNAHLALIGPASGSAVAPTFRLLASGDIPDLSATYLTPAAGNAAYQPLAANLTSLAAAATNNSLYYRVSSGTWAPVTIGSNVALSGGTLSATGSVTSVGLSVPSIFSVAGSPVTGTGTLALSLATQTQKTFWAGPTSGAAATPTFRAIAFADVPDLSTVYQPLDADLTALAALTGTHTIYYRSAANTWSPLTIGGGLDFTGGTLNLATVVTVTGGGTGQTTYTDGELLIGNSTGNTLTKATLTGTANQVVVTNGSGSITLSTPQDINTTSSPSFVGLTLSANLALPSTSSSAAGVITQNGDRLLHTYNGNIFFGKNAGNFTTTGIENVGIGEAALGNLTTGSDNFAFGKFAMVDCTAGGANVALGVNAMGSPGPFDGSFNIGIGTGALFLPESYRNNIAIGFNSMSNPTGENNTAIGVQAMFACGGGAPYTNQSNVAIGYFALYSCSAIGSTGVGYASLYGQTTGAGNVSLGYQSGVTATDANKTTTGGSNTFIGAFSGQASATQRNLAIAIGYSALVDASNTCVIGGTTASGNAVDIAAGATTAAAKLHLVKTTEQLRLGYDASNYVSFTVGIAGALTVDATGASAGFGFNDPVKIGSGGTAMASALSAVKAGFDCPIITAGGGVQTTTLTVTGATTSSVAKVSIPSGGLDDGVVVDAYVSAADTVTIKFTNTNTLSAIDPGSKDYRVFVVNF